MRRLPLVHHIKVWLAPTFAGAVLAAHLLGASFLIGGGAEMRSGGVGWTYQWSATGPLGSIITTTKGAGTTIEVDWPRLMIALGGSYVTAMVIGRLVSGGWGRLCEAPRQPWWRGAGALLVYVTGGCVLAGAIGAAVVSSAYWGYPLQRPPLDSPSLKPRD